MTRWMMKRHPSTTCSKGFDFATHEQSYRFRTRSETSYPVHKTFPTNSCRTYVKNSGPLTDGNSFHRLQGLVQQQCPSAAECLEQPITLDEVTAAIKSGPQNKTPGLDGICFEFYSANWETVHMNLLELLNNMFLQSNITPRQKHGVLICLPKSDGDNTQRLPPYFAPKHRLQTSSADPGKTPPAGHGCTTPAHTILWGTGQLHPRCGIASSGRNCTPRKHRYPLVHSDVGLSQRF
jgi:hypothetical protein